MSDTQIVLLMLVVAGLASGWIWYLGDDELERQKWVQRTTGKTRRDSNSTPAATGLRCNSEGTCGSGENHAPVADGPL